MGKEAFPLTDAQKGIWLGQQLDPKSPMYNAAEYISLEGSLNKPIFKRVVEHVFRETRALNVVFKSLENEPVQYFSHSNFQLNEIDFSKEEHPELIALEWMNKNLSYYTDLENGPLFETVIIQLNTHYHFWYQRIHHVASDGYSFALLTQRVAELYQALLGNKEIGFSKVGKGFGDYLQLLEIDGKYKESPFYEKDKTFWLELMGDQPPITSFSSSKEPIANRSIKYVNQISSGLIEKMQAIAGPLKATWSDFLMALVVSLLYKERGTKDITLGVPVMGRIGTPALRIPGMVMNIVPLRVKIEENTCFSAVVEKIAHQIRKGRPHHRYRYEQLRRDLGKIGGDQRLFGPVVNIMPFDRSLNFGNCKAAAFGLSAGPVEDLSFGFIMQPGGGLRFDLDANPNRYNKQELAKIGDLFLQSFHQYLTEPAKFLKVNKEGMSWLSGEEQQAILPSVWELIKKQALLYPQNIAIQSGEVLWTYTGLKDKVNHLANGLLAKGLKQGNIVALAMPRSEWAIASLLAVLSQGAAFVFLDGEAPKARNLAILKDAQPSLIITEDLPADFLSEMEGENITQIHLDELKKLELLGEKEASMKSLETDFAAYLIYTSGSTGNPKGVVVGQKALTEFVDSAISTYGFSEKDTVLQFAPMHFDTCIEEIFGALCSGAKLVVRNEKMLSSIPDFMNQCSNWGITVLDLPTAYWHEVAFACAAKQIKLPEGLKTVIIGGEAVQPERVKQWMETYGSTIDLWNSYGPSEATVVATVANLSNNHEAISIGKPLPGRYILVVDEALQVLPKGESGELILLGGGLANGYLNLNNQTDKVFVEVKVDWLNEKLRGYRTGDKVRINEENNIEYIGRLDDQIKISGQRIDPLEIEGHLIQLQGVQEAAIVIQTQANGLKSLVAHLAGADLEEDKIWSDIGLLRKELSGYLPAAMLPSNVIIHQALPKTSTGKINRKKLAELKLEATNDVGSFELTPAELIVADVWQQVLGKTGIKSNDDFFLLGGQSLQTIQVANRLSAKFNKEVPVTTVFQNPTVADLAEVLLGLAENNGSKNQTGSSIEEKLKLMEADIKAFEKSFSQKNPDLKLSFSNAQVQKENVVLLTGATGFVGAQLLYQVLDQSSNNVICLVRAASIKMGKQKLEKAFDAQGLPKNKLNRVEVILSDLESSNLGLSDNQIGKIGSKINLIIHNAAITSVMRDYQSLRSANSFSTATLLEWAAKWGASFHLVSTIAVAPPSSVTPKLEENYVGIHSGLLDGYQQSKWVSEEMARIAMKKGLPVSVYRLGRVTGSTTDAYVNEKDLVWSILRIGLHHGFLPELPIKEPWTPVNILAEFMVSHALSQGVQAVFNLMPETQISLLQIYEWLKVKGYEFDTVSLEKWCKYLKANGRDEDLSILGFFDQRQKLAKEGHKLEITPIDYALFKNKSEEFGTLLPNIDQYLFNHYLNYAITHELIPTQEQCLSAKFMEEA